MGWGREGKEIDEQSCFQGPQLTGEQLHLLELPSQVDSLCNPFAKG